MNVEAIAYVESVTKGVAVYRVGVVRDGRTVEGPVGPAFAKPHEAARYAERMERRAAQESAA